jgi:hypothetical protein
MIEGLPREWSRGPQWVSPEALAEWGPILREAASAWEQLEILSVSAKVRDSALLYLTPDELVRATRESASQGLLVLPLAWDGTHHRAALTRPNCFGEWIDAWALNDDDRIGKLLGFPECCRAHFAETWGRGKTDTVLHMAPGSAGCHDGPPECNTMLRQLGVRLVPHLPCSPTCEASRKLGFDFVNAANEAGLDLRAVYQFLNLPVTYSVLNGVAITETPHFRFMSGSDLSWGSAQRGPSKMSEAYLRKSEEAIQPAVGGLDESAQDNGFATFAAIEEAHEVVLQAVGFPASAIDLGCGDGYLLNRIRRRSGSPALSGPWVGVESDAGRVERGRARHPELRFNPCQIQDLIVDLQDPVDVVLLMPGRLLEMKPEEAHRVRGWLLETGRRVVAYSYGDWSKVPLDQLLERAGLRAIGTHYSANGVQACSSVVPR